MKSFKVGAIVLATHQGLGILAKSFYNNDIIDKVFVWPHSSRENHYSWYPDRVKRLEDLLECDVVLGFETFFNWKIIPMAREKGVKTALMPMYECTPNPLPYQPDLIISPSLLDKQYFPESIYIPVPVDVKWELRREAKVFVHNAGNGGLGGRNGTKELIEAWKHVKSPAKLIIRSQTPLELSKDERIDVQVGTLPYADLWTKGDVFIFPEKFNGLSLPIQEAYASGMLVMASNRFPNFEYLPNEPLIPVREFKKESLAREFDLAVIHIEDIANTVDYWYNRDITDFSYKGLKYGNENSWERLKPIYVETLSNLQKGI